MFLTPCIVALLLAFITNWLRRRGATKSNEKLPPGSMGFPLIGETIQFFTPHKLYDIPPFIQKRVARYGSVFRTSLVGQRVIVSTDPEINYTIFQLEDKSFKCWYTESFIKLFGQESPVGHHGTFHKYLKNIILNLIGPENLRQNHIHEMDALTCANLHSWAKATSVNVKGKIANMIFDYSAKKLFGYDEAKTSRKLRESYKAFLDGLISFPLNIPGTSFYACLQGRKNAVDVIKDALNHRRSSNAIGGDYLDYLLLEMKKGKPLLSEPMAIDLIFALLFAAYETTSTSITLLMKFLSDHPSVVDRLSQEHDEILKNRKVEDSYSGVTWREYKSMNFTHMVINETVRLANIVPGIFRKVLEDVEIKGYTFPAGWVVMISPQALHLDPSEYKDPLSFNPWRWKGHELHAGSKTFMAFGGGVRLCVGADFAKLQMAIFIHYLVTKYRWTVIKGGDIIRKPGLIFPNGLHINISEKSN